MVAIATILKPLVSALFRSVAVLLFACALPARAANVVLRPWPARTATPALALTGIDGRQWTAQDLRGKVVILNFWASWCGPCIDELPVLNALAREHPDLLVLGVNFKENADTIAAFAAAHPFAYPILRDRGGDALKAWSAGGVLPATILLDRRGRARWRMIGELTHAETGWKQALDRLLAERETDTGATMPAAASVPAHKDK
jgi:cytochrome c biogenesis protein CcmG/thiol:disulfide interchange protein DsbE